jgi:hypothetical protein
MNLTLTRVKSLFMRRPAQHLLNVVLMTSLLQAPVCAQISPEQFWMDAQKVKRAEKSKAARTRWPGGATRGLGCLSPETWRASSELKSVGAEILYRVGGAAQEKPANIRSFLR